MKSYKGWTIRVSANVGFFSSGRGGKTVRSYSAYKDPKAMFSPSVNARNLKDLKKYIDDAEREANAKGYWDIIVF